MARPSRVAGIVLGGLGALLLLAVVTGVVVVQTDWGRERIRVVLESQMEGVVDGTFRIGRLGGNPLVAPVLHDVLIAGPDGRPFLEAGTVSWRLSLPSLLRRRILLTDLGLEGAFLVLDRRPDEEWNFTRIFAADPESAPEPDPGPGWGSWIDLRNVTFVDSRLVLRMPWEPDQDLPEPEREQRARAAVAGEGLARVVDVPGGFQTVMEFRDVEAELSRVLVAHPDTAWIPVEVAALSLVAAPLRTPEPGVIEHAEGFIRIGEESVELSGLDLRLPGSRLMGEASLELETGETHAAIRADPISLVDLRFLQPSQPAGIEARMRLALDVGSEITHVVANELDATLRDGRVEGYVDLAFGDEVSIGESLLTLTNVPTELLRGPPFSVEALPVGRLDGQIAAEPVEGYGNASPEIRLAARLDFDPQDAPEATATGEGRVVLGETPGLRGMAIEVDALNMELVRALAPGLRMEGELAAAVTLDGPVRGPLEARGTLVHRDPEAGTSRVSLAGSAAFQDDIRLREVRVGLDPIHVRSLRGYVEGLPRAQLSGDVWVDGPVSGLLETEGVLAVADSASGTSRIAFEGGVRGSPSPGFRTFEVSIVPLRMEMLGSLMGEPGREARVGGEMEGHLHLDGSLEDGLLVRADLLHAEEGERSRVEGEGWIERQAGWQSEGHLRVHELALGVAGRFVPELRLRGTAAGLLEFEASLGPESRLETFLRGDLELGEEGRVELETRFHRLEEVSTYAGSARLADIDLEELSSRMPGATSLAGQVDLEGRGTDPADLDLTAAVSLRDAEAEERSLAVSLRASDGRLRLDSLVASARGAAADVRGDFGLVEDAAGELRTRVAVDSLGVFSPLLRSLTAGEEAPDADAPVGPARDVVAGRMEAEGSVRGSLRSFDARGELQVRDLLAFGNRIGSGTAGFEAAGLGEGAPHGTLSFSAEQLTVAGLRYDSVSVDAWAEASGPDERAPRSIEGSGTVALHQGDDVGAHLSAGWDLGSDRNEVRVDRLDLEFEEARYRIAAPFTARWGAGAVEIADFVIESDLGARVQLDARIPAEDGDGAEPGDGLLLIEELQLQHVLQLAQRDDGTRALLDARVPMEGTLREPAFGGTVALTWVSLGARAFPDFLAEFGYEGRVLEARADVVESTTRDTMVVAEASVPVDLSMAGSPTPRLLDEELRVELRIDDLSLATLPALTDQVEAVRGRADGRLLVEGRPGELGLDGSLTFDVPTVFVAPLGVRMERIAGAARVDGRTLAVDSVVAHSGGPIRLSGEIDLAEIGAPGFDLAVRANGARIMDTGDVRLEVDADLVVEGPFDAVDLTGEIRARSGEIRIPEISELAAAGPLDLEDPEVFQGIDPALVAARDSLLAPSPLLENLRVDVDLHVDRDVWVRSTETNVEVYTPPQVGPLSIRTVGLRGSEIEVEGTITTDRGQYEFLGRRFDLTRGSATFPGGSTIDDPLIRLTAEHEVQVPGREPIDIRLIVDGTPQDLETQLESTAQPPMSQTDLLSMVAFGRDAGSLLQFQGSGLGGQGTAGVAALATQRFATVGLQAVVTELETETARALGLDVLHIRPADLPAEVSTGGFLDVLRGTEIEAGRYVTSHLYVAGQARPTLVHPGALVEYQTEHGWVWRTTWRPRFLPAVPTLAQQEPERASVFGSFLAREWRF